MPVATPPVTRPTAQYALGGQKLDDEHTASEQDSGDAERNRGSKEEVFTGINARGTIAGGLGRQSTQLEQEEPDEILCVGWKKRNVIAGGRTRETAIDFEPTRDDMIGLMRNQYKHFWSYPVFLSRACIIAVKSLRAMRQSRKEERKKKLTPPLPVIMLNTSIPPPLVWSV
ncbi:hypothetical protein BT96DRAFT_1001926 [Gymnopus androsaceus JB14]|uniref:Uncharacterized protein n=1 Tax=Gymnopus androsaceus JB14 TaxID=1447944 RepID=A0A6A4GY22_9AGAR|nr:hypothetical protein BT96DRAFT_1001926 [Gymnopus androsaceus JB14]